jgi:uncharacterized protein (TIGR01244 family)
MTIRCLHLLTICAAVMGLGSAAVRADDAAPLSDFQQPMADGVTVAGALHADAFARLPAGTRVIDLRSAEEGTGEAAAAAAERGVDYHNVPVPGAVIDPRSVAEVARLIDEADGAPVILHCASGNRAGMIWGAVQVRRGAALADVRERLAAVPMRPAAEEALAAFAESCAAAADGCPPGTPAP